jgi:hypothetical protein
MAWVSCAIGEMVVRRSVRDAGSASDLAQRETLDAALLEQGPGPRVVDQRELLGAR